MSSSALLYEYDLRIAFFAGAWISVITLCAAAVEAQFRHVFTEDYETKAHALYGDDADLDWLRSFRNEIMHVGPPGSQSQLFRGTSADLRDQHRALEEDARRAIQIMVRIVFGMKRL